MSQAVHESRATIKPLSESSQINSSFMDIVVILPSVSRDHETMMLRNQISPLEGGDMAKGKHCRPGTSFKHAIANQKKGHAPSFKGKMQPLIGLLSASDFLGNIRKAEQHAENLCICKIVFASATTHVLS